jgi:hypothetical protein
MFIYQAFGVAAIALELRFDPIDGGAIAVSALPPVAELGQGLDRRFVFFEIEPSGEHRDRIACHRLLRGCGRCRLDEKKREPGCEPQTTLAMHLSPHQDRAA